MVLSLSGKGLSYAMNSAQQAELREELQNFLAEQCHRRGWLMSAFVAAVEILSATSSEEDEFLIHLVSHEAQGWKAYGMATYLQGSQTPKPGWAREEDD